METMLRNACLCLLVSLSISACAKRIVTAPKGRISGTTLFAKLERGMSLDQMKEMLGEPALSWPKEDDMQVYYYHIDGMDSSDLTLPHISGVSVFFRGQKLEEWKFAYTKVEESRPAGK